MLSTGLAVRTPRDTLINAALWWRDHVSTAPETALHRAETWLSRSPVNPELQVLARHVACLATVERGRLGEARAHARRGLKLARRAGLVRREAQLRFVLAWVELDRGEQRASWEHLAASEPHLRGRELSRATCLRGLLLCRRDRYREAVVELTDAARRLHRDGDRHWLGNALLARGMAHLHLYRLEDADADLFAAEQVFTADGRTARAAACRHHRGCVALRGGDLAGALRLFSHALETGLDPQAHPEVIVDRAEALALAGLDAEARTAMRDAVVRLAAHGRHARLAETRLALALGALRDGDLVAAGNEANASRRLFQAQGRPAWAALAAATKWQAVLRGGRPWPGALLAARRAAAICASRGWAAAAAELRLTAGRVALRGGWTRAGRKLLAEAATARDDTDLPSAQRAVGWLADALLAAQNGDQARVFAACRGGLRAIGTYASEMVALDLRVHAFGLAGDLADAAIGTALSTGDARVVLRWSERCRASALTRRTLRPPTDPKLRTALVRLRAAAAELRDSQRRDPRKTTAKVTALEDQVRHRAMLVEGSIKQSQVSWGIHDVVSVLGESTMLSFFAHSGQMYAVSIMDGDVRLHRLGAEATVVAEVERLRYFLARQAEEASLRVRMAYSQGARHAAEAIEAHLLAPVLHRLPAGRPLVVVPTGCLHTLPWAELPSCRGRSVTVTPSLRSWLRAVEDVGSVRSGAGHVWVSGPGLEHAEREVRVLHSVSGGQLLTGADATAERVLRTVDGARTAHIAAHGWFRDDQPQLSCLDLADGPLYGYDFDRLHQAPTTVVLSACEVGQSAVRCGDELSGLAIALLGRGTATVISSVVPVPDERTAEVMVSLHSGLRRGVPPAAALATAQAEYGESGFLCLGYGGG